MAALAPKLSYTELDDHVNIEMEDLPHQERLDLGRELSEASQIAAVVQQLHSMGFSDEQSTVAAFYGKSIDGALEFLTSDRAAHAHLFIPGDTREICAICFQFEADHTAKMNLNNKPQERKEPEKKIDMEKVMANLPVITGNGMVCQICFCEYQENEIEILKCTHFFCKDCISGWIRTQVTDGKVSDKQIFCPNVECKQPIEAQVIEDLSPPEIWEKYQRFTFALEVDRDKNATWCPAAGCKGVIYRPNGIVRKGICEECKFEICFLCKNAFHGNFSSCTREVDEKFEQFAKDQFMKRCPSCSKYIIKLEGCNHMTCSCGYQFCWICGGKYYGMHFAPFNIFGCPGMQFTRTNGLCTNNIIVRVIFKFLQILLFTALGLIFIGIECGLILPCAAFVWIVGFIHYKRTDDDCGMDTASAMACFFMFFMDDDD
eukprot:TRINITY_DN6609_c0_g1_i1.p1 TRINITY_DN6609_c0_g1~~TRINITY_DN6609_c0_g1_i1.p1  ORF type:complete len:431 (-),score=92.59 TRINITY_DN6609_c0_g1_i1:35-1327(-)